MYMTLYECSGSGAVSGKGLSADWYSLPSGCTTQINTAANTFPKASLSGGSVLDPVQQIYATSDSSLGGLKADTFYNVCETLIFI